MQVDGIALQETIVTLGGQRAMQNIAKKSGWRALWGCPLVAPTGGIWGAEQGGVGFLVREGWPCRRVEPTEDAAAQRLWGSGRWLHVTLALGCGRQVLNIQVVSEVMPSNGSSSRPLTAVAVSST